MHNTRLWVRALLRLGFVRKRDTGGHAMFSRGTTLVPVPVHKRELSNREISTIRRAMAQFQERP